MLPHFGSCPLAELEFGNADLRHHVVSDCAGAFIPWFETAPGRGQHFDQGKHHPLYFAGSAARSIDGRCAGTLLCVQTLRIHGFVGNSRAGSSIEQCGRGRRRCTCKCKYEWTRHQSSRPGKGDPLCRSEPINRSGSSASASSAFWPAWPTVAGALCWPVGAARGATRSPSRKRTSSRRIARSLASARGGQPGTPLDGRRMAALRS